jgi:hypothetical protein
MIIQPTQNADSPGGSGSIPGRKIAVHKSCSASSLKGPANAARIAAAKRSTSFSY